MDEYQRALADLTTRAEGAQAELGTAVRDKDGADATVNSQRVGSLEVELEKLRKQIRDLQTESANREVHIAQMEKQRERDREDLQGLNIALDSKQQELELVGLIQPPCFVRTERVNPSTDETADGCQGNSRHDTRAKQGRSYPPGVDYGYSLPVEYSSRFPPLRCQQGRAEGRKDLRAVFNHCACRSAGQECPNQYDFHNSAKHRI
jgi:hypothetical protein